MLDASRAAVCVTVDSFGGVDYDRRLAEVAPATLKHRVVVGDAARTGAIDFDEFFVRTPWEQRHPLDERRRRPGRTTRSCCSTPPAPPAR